MFYQDDQGPDSDQNERFVIKEISREELEKFCRDEIFAVETLMKEKFKDISKDDFNFRTFIKEIGINSSHSEFCDLS